jgi:hypothetical protein
MTLCSKVFPRAEGAYSAFRSPTLALAPPPPSFFRALLAAGVILGDLDQRNALGWMGECGARP